MTQKILQLTAIGLVLAVAGLGASSALGETTAVKPSKTQWTPAAPVPDVGGLEGACDGTIGDKIYEAFGLSPSEGDTNHLRIYDVPSDTWSAGPDAPTFGRSEFYQGVTKGHTLYCLGARSTDESWSFDTSTGTWTPLAPEPDPALRVGTAAAGQGDSIYVFGGRHGGGGPCSDTPVTPADVDGTILHYDIKTDTWSPGGNLVVPRTDATASTVGDKIYIFGGCDATGLPLDNYEVYDPKTQTSTLVATTPTPGGGRSDMESYAKGGKIHIVGGGGVGLADPLFNYVIFDVKAGTFSTGPNVPTHCPVGVGRGELDVQIQGDRLFAIAGSCPGFGLSIGEVDVLKV